MTYRSDPGAVVAALRDALGTEKRGLHLLSRMALAGIVATALLAGCSTVRMAYNQLDWLIANRIENSISLDREQRVVLKRHIDTLLKWHCQTQLPEYVRWLRVVTADFATGMTVARLRAHSASLEGAWYAVMERAVPAAVDVLGSLSDRQIEELLASVEDANKEYRKDYIDPPDSEWRENNKEWMGKMLRRWLGTLTHDQEQVVRRWAKTIVPMREIGWDNRVRWQTEFQSVLAQRENAQILSTGLYRLLIDWDRYQTIDYRRAYAQNSNLIADLLVTISQTMTPSQKKHLATKTMRYAADFDSVACGKDEQRAHLRHGAQILSARKP